jgi:hypothetical protein
MGRYKSNKSSSPGLLTDKVGLVVTHYALSAVKRHAVLYYYYSGVQQQQRYIIIIRPLTTIPWAKMAQFPTSRKAPGTCRAPAGRRINVAAATTIYSYALFTHLT